MTPTFCLSAVRTWVGLFPSLMWFDHFGWSLGSSEVCTWSALWRVWSEAVMSFDMVWFSSCICPAERWRYWFSVSSKRRQVKRRSPPLQGQIIALLCSSFLLSVLHFSVLLSLRNAVVLSCWVLLSYFLFFIVVQFISCILQLINRTSYFQRKWWTPFFNHMKSWP